MFFDQQLMVSVWYSNKYAMNPATYVSNHVEPSGDYSILLAQYGLKCKLVDCYLQVGDITKVQGWILHISVIWTQVFDLLTAVIPVLISNGVAFKVPQNKDVAIMLASGSLSYYKLGKLICLYPESDEAAIRLVKLLVDLTNNFKGCDIPTDMHLGGRVYTRYGAFSPVLRIDEYGRSRSCIYDFNGVLFEDEYFVPFIMPAGIEWPFSDFQSNVSFEINTFIKDKYKILSVIKSDRKGRVIKALMLTNLFFFKWCVIKEGKRNMCSDDQERDVRDRLRWQYELHLQLHSELYVPKVYDFFYEGDNAYLVMEFVSGNPLSEVIDAIYGSNCWLNLATSKKVTLIEYLICVIDIIQSLHSKGFVHRDITPVNFILGKNGRLIMIDLELMYSLDGKYEEPPFVLGTEGFMSLEQRNVQRPTYKEDIYGLGALMIVFFTNLSPIHFESGSMFENLLFFIRDRSLVKVISDCLSSDPNVRPELETIKTTILLYKNEISGSSKVQLSYESPDLSAVMRLISEGVEGLGSPILKESGRIWCSNVIDEGQEVVNRSKIRASQVGLFSGVSGIVYFLSIAKGCGLFIEGILDAYHKSIGYVEKRLSTPVLPPSGMFYGSYGIAIAIATGLRNRVIEESPHYHKMISRCLDFEPLGINLTSGLAGRGLALLHCKPYLENDVYVNLIERTVQEIIDCQEKDGSWMFESENSNRKLKISGFSSGVAGIVCFLLAYYKYSNHHRDVSDAIVKALRWLTNVSIESKGKRIWYVNDRSKVIDPWLQDGITGIALCFLKAYETFDDPSFEMVAKKTLLNHPENLVNGDFSVATGITGIGEIYIDAFAILKEDIWRERLDWIVNHLIHTYRGGMDMRHWQVDRYPPSADLMVGNSGILHFLLRYATPKSIEFPLFPSPIL